MSLELVCLELSSASKATLLFHMMEKPVGYMRSMRTPVNAALALLYVRQRPGHDNIP